MKKQYPKNLSSLIYCDTDSLLYSVQTENIYRDMVNNSKFFDFSNFPVDANIFKEMNLNREEIENLMNDGRKKVGRMKDECASMITLAVIAPRSKSYAMKIQGTVITDSGSKISRIKNYDITSKKKCGGTRKSVIKEHLLFTDFYKYLNRVQNKTGKNKQLKVRQNRIASKDCKLYSITQVKTSISGFDLKRRVMKDNITTYPLGYQGPETFNIY